MNLTAYKDDTKNEIQFSGEFSVVYIKKGEQVCQTGNYANDFDGKELLNGKYSFEFNNNCGECDLWEF